MTHAFNAALLRTGTVTFLVVSVRVRVYDNAYESELVRIAFELRFRVPVVVMAQDDRGHPRYRGRPTLVAALRGIFVTSLPWQRFA